MAKESARKPLFWLHDLTIQTPPFSKEARVEAGTLLRRIQEGELLSMPHSRPMPSIGKKCHEVRVRDENRIWRVVYRVDFDAIVVAAVFSKTTQATPQSVISQARARLRLYDDTVKSRKKGLKNE